MNKEYIVGQWSAAIANGTFFVGKHDETGLSMTWDSFRTVLSAEAAANLSGFITSGNYAVRVFEDTKFPRSSGYYEIIPSGQAPFSVAGSGVASGSLTPSGDYDRLVVAYGKKNPGWHVYADDSARIASSTVSGRLALKYEL